MSQENILKEIINKKKGSCHKALRKELLTLSGENDLYVMFKKMFIANDVKNGSLLLEAMPLSSVFNSGEFRKDVKSEYEKEKKNLKLGVKNNPVVLTEKFFYFIGQCKKDLTAEKVNNIIIDKKMLNKRSHDREPLFYSPKNNLGRFIKIWSALQDIGWILPEELIETALYLSRSEVYTSDVFVKIMDKHITQRFENNEKLPATHNPKPKYIYDLLSDLSTKSMGSFKDKYNTILNRAIVNNNFLEQLQNEENIDFKRIMPLISQATKLGVSKEDLNHYLNPLLSASNLKEIKEILSMGYNIQPENPNVKAWCTPLFSLYSRKKEDEVADILVFATESGLNLLAPFENGETILDKIKKDLGKYFSPNIERIAVALQEKKIISETIQPLTKMENKKIRRI